MRTEGELHPSGAGTGYGLGRRVGGLDAPLDRAVWHTGGAPATRRCCSCCPSRTPPWSSSRTCTGSSRTGR
ncbi:hypothetical protein ACFQXA_03240 [Nocardiopsis composta]